MLKLDGSKLEGGGQLTRMAICLSAITGQAITVHSIRAGRAAKGASKQQSFRGKDKYHDKSPSHNPKAIAGGLKESHLAALQWLAAATFADVDGAEVGSTEVTFHPGKLKGKFGPGVPERARMLEAQLAAGGAVVDTIRLKNPGSIWLIFQAIYPYMVFSSRVHRTRNPSDSDNVISEQPNLTEPNTPRALFDLTLIGGTNVPKSMSTEYVQQVFLPMCEKIGLPKVQIDPVRSGWTAGRLDLGEVRIRMYAPQQEPAPESTTASEPEPPPAPVPSLSSGLSTLHLEEQQASTDGRNPFQLPAFSLTDRGEITRIDITILSAPYLHAAITDNLTTALTTHASYATHNQPPIETTAGDSRHERRIYMLLVAHTATGLRLGRDYLGDGGKPKPGDPLGAACRALVDKFMRELDSKACVDKYMQDQIVAFQALAGGPTQVAGAEEPGVCADDGEDESADRSGSLHTRTVRWVCETMLDVRFEPGGVCKVGSQV